MIRKDYVERLIEQFARALARVLKLSQEGKHQEAQQALEGGCEQVLGVPFSTLTMLDSASAASMLEDGIRIKMYARILIESARVLERQPDPVRAASRRQHALEMYLEARSRLPADPEVAQAIAELVAQVPPHALPARARALLIESQPG